MPTKKTMTLNLPEREMLALEALAKDADMTKTGIMRQALRVYQALCYRRDRGEIEWDELFGLSKYRRNTSEDSQPCSPQPRSLRRRNER